MMTMTVLHTIRYDARCCFNVRSKADTSQLNLPRGNRQLKSGKTEELKSKKTDMLGSIGESVESVLEKKRKAAVGRICRKERFQARNGRVKE